MLQVRVMNWTERLRKYEEEEQLKKMEQAAEQAAAAAAEMNSDKLDDAMQLFDKPSLCRHHFSSHVFYHYM